MVNIEPDVGIEGGADQIRQVLWNLLRNAAEAMPQGGTVRIRVARAEVAGRTTATVLSVSDTGVGISEEDQDQIFEPFFSKKRGGTGLGLATVARIVEDHKGHIEVTSAPGRGTEFSLRFPSCLRPGPAHPDRHAHLALACFRAGQFLPLEQQGQSLDQQLSPDRIGMATNRLVVGRLEPVGTQNLGQLLGPAISGVFPGDADENHAELVPRGAPVMASL